MTTPEGQEPDVADGVVPAPPATAADTSGTSPATDTTGAEQPEASNGVVHQAGERPTTIYDIARVAGVAPSTVSRALSRPGRVATETAARVYEVAEQLGYKRMMPRRLRASEEETYVIALVIADVGNPFFTQLMIGIQQQASTSGYTVLLLDSRESATEEKAAIERVLHLIDGIVLSGSRMSNGTIQQFNRCVPVVSLNRQVPGVTSIVPDSFQGMQVVVDHLVAHGHESVTYVAGPSGSWASGARWEGLSKACRRAGVRVRQIGPFPPTLRGGVSAVEAWAQAPTTAVVGYNDVVAIGFMRSAMWHGVRVPEDVSIIGIDNAGMSALTRPGLTSLSAGIRRLSEVGADAIVGHLRHRSQDQPMLTHLPMRLKERESVAAAPERLSLPPTLMSES